MPRSRAVFFVGSALAAAVFSGACGDDKAGGAEGLATFFPPIPAPTGDAQAVFAGPIDAAHAGELLTGPAATGRVGDFFLRNDRVAFVISSPARVIGVIPQGGNLVDAALKSGGIQRSDDHFGELALIYKAGRTCEHETVEIVQDGAGGGAAVVRAVGKTANDDFLNINGIGVFPIDDRILPDIDDGLLCATTYVLYPGATSVEVYHSIFNPTEDRVTGPMGVIADTGGNTETWANQRGFERANIGDLNSLSTPAPIDYVFYQGPGVGYGVIPRHDVPVPHAQALISGVSLLLLDCDKLLDILSRDHRFLQLDPQAGLLQRYDVTVGNDVNATDDQFRTGVGQAMTPVSGTAVFSGVGSGPALGARVGVYRDANGNGLVDAAADIDGDHVPDEAIISYLDVDGSGAFSGTVPTGLGNLILRAEVKEVGRSAALPAGTGLELTVPSPIKLDYTIVDDATGEPIPGRILVVGEHPAIPDGRVFETHDRLDGVVVSQHAVYGATSDGVAEGGSDPTILVPAGGPYRVFATRGTEWSAASAALAGSADADVELRLRQVAPATGYLATEWHVHQVGSPDSSVLSDERVRSALSSGVEMFAVTDHDFVSNLQPIVEDFGAQQRLRVLPGIEVTPFPYGHFQAWPLEQEPESPNFGAIDWARGGVAGDAMTPAEIFSAMRTRGAQMVQVNHPRQVGLSQFQAYFDRANVVYDYVNRTIFGDFGNAGVPNEYLRLPDESLWTDTFNGLEVWNGFATGDSDGDGVRENNILDRVLRDYFNMLSLGFTPTPAANSDTHTSVADPVGMPRTYVRVADDSGAALENGSAIDDVLATMTGKDLSNAPVARDVVLTDGPMLSVTATGLPAIGRVVSATASTVTLSVTITAADWAEFDTLEVFANATPETPVTTVTGLVPLKCWTSRPLAGIPAGDACNRAHLAPEPMVVDLVAVAPGFNRFEATVLVTLQAADIDTRVGATGTDAWLVFRARGDRSTFPVMTTGALDGSTLPTILGGDFTAIRAALQGLGVQAIALTAPIFVDFDGGGYRAPFAPTSP